MKRRGLTIWVLTLTVILLLFLIPNPVGKKVQNFVSAETILPRSALTKTGEKISAWFSLIADIGNLRQENLSLSNDLITTKVNQAKMDQLENENSSLKASLDYKNANPNLKLLYTEIVTLDPTNYLDFVTINRGSDDGVKSGDAVTSLGVLVGKIDRVQAETSRVMLITNKNSITQVMLENSGTTGILRGGISGMTLDDVPLDTSVAANENIITSGLGGSLPKGIFVGNTGSKISTNSDIFKSLLVTSPIDFSKLNNLFVVTGV